MIEFLRLQYKLGHVTEAQLRRLADVGRITQAECALILEGGN